MCTVQSNCQDVKNLFFIIIVYLQPKQAQHFTIYNNRNVYTDIKGEERKRKKSKEPAHYQVVCAKLTVIYCPANEVVQGKENKRTHKAVAKNREKKNPNMRSIEKITSHQKTSL